MKEKKCLNFNYFLSFLKKGIKKTIQASKKNILPNIDQKFPKLEITKPTADTINKIQPSKLIFLLFINYKIINIII